MIFLAVLDALAMIAIFVVRLAIMTVVYTVVLGILAVAGLVLLGKAIVLAIRRGKGQQRGLTEPAAPAEEKPPDSQCPYHLTSEGKINYAAPRFPRTR